MEKLLKKYDLSKVEITKIKKNSKIKSTEDFKNRIKELSECLALSDDEIKKILIKYPTILTYSTEMIMKKQKEYINTLGFSTEEFKTLIVRSPETISYGIQAILNKGKFLSEKIGTGKKEFKRIILKFPGILKHNNESLNKKINLYLNNKIEKDEIIHNPTMFTLSTSTFITRLAICKFFRISIKTFLNKKFYMENENKLYSNLMYLKEKNVVFSRYNIVARKLPKSNKIYSLHPFDKTAKKVVFYSAEVYDENGNEIE